MLLGKSRQKTEHIAALPWAEVPAFYATLTEAASATWRSGSSS